MCGYGPRQIALALRRNCPTKILGTLRFPAMNTHTALQPSPALQKCHLTRANPRTKAKTTPKQTSCLVTLPKIPQETLSPISVAHLYVHTFDRENVVLTLRRAGSTTKRPPLAPSPSAKSATACSAFCSSSTATFPTTSPATSVDCTSGAVEGKHAGGKKVA